MRPYVVALKLAARTFPGAVMSFPHLVLARLYEHLEPIDRGNRYEDPLQARLEESKLGQVTGGGTQLNEDGGIAYADVEIELANLDDAVQAVAEALESAGAPEGSELIHAEDSKVLREFGRQQCLAIFLDGSASPGTEPASRAARLDGARTTKLAAPVVGARRRRAASSRSAVLLDPRSDESPALLRPASTRRRSCRDGSRQLSVHGR